MWGGTKKECKTSDKRVWQPFEWSRTSQQRVEHAGTTIEECYGPCKSYHCCVPNLLLNLGDRYSVVSISLTVDTCGIWRQLLFEIVLVSHTFKYFISWKLMQGSQLYVIEHWVLLYSTANRIFTKMKQISYLTMIFLPASFVAVRFQYSTSLAILLILFFNSPSSVWTWLRLTLKAALPSLTFPNMLQWLCPSRLLLLGLSSHSRASIYSLKELVSTNGWDGPFSLSTSSREDV